MGCIPSKQQVLSDDDTPSSCFSSKPKSHSHSTPSPHGSKKPKNRGPPSPIVEGDDIPPWLQKRAVLSEKDGCYILSEPVPMEVVGSEKDGSFK